MQADTLTHHTKAFFRQFNNRPWLGKHSRSTRYRNCICTYIHNVHTNLDMTSSSSLAGCILLDFITRHFLRIR
nr:unnamed protein product [Fasciola hepatica]